MQYRPLDLNYDYTVGVPFLANSPATVAQLILTRLRLWKGEWFIDTTDGTPYLQNVLGKPTGQLPPDAYIKQRILSTQAVTSISSYSASYNGNTRNLMISATVNTLYGKTTISTAL